MNYLPNSVNICIYFLKINICYNKYNKSIYILLNQPNFVLTA